ncbi:hypothetical protein [Nocardia sp. IFM 10818]
MEFEITEMEHRTERGLFGTTIEGWSASVTFASGERLSLSQLDGEAPDWGVDAAFGANSFPTGATDSVRAWSACTWSPTTSPKR